MIFTIEEKSEIYLKTLKLGLRCHYVLHLSFSEDELKITFWNIKLVFREIDGC